jgi:hypothetical protein
MSLNIDLSQLYTQHRGLEKELKDAVEHPASTDEEIAFIKRQKLKLKDEIARLERHTPQAA